MDALDAEMFSREVLQKMSVADVYIARCVSRTWLGYFGQDYWRARRARDPDVLAQLMERFDLKESQFRYLFNILKDRDQKMELVPRTCNSSFQRARWHIAASLLGLYTVSVPTGLQAVKKKVAWDGYDSDGDTYSVTIAVRTAYGVVIANRPDRLPAPVAAEDKDRPILTRTYEDSPYDRHFKSCVKHVLKEAKKKKK